MNTELKQLIQIIQYRLQRSLQHASEEYYGFKARNKARTPREIRSHLVDVSDYGLGVLKVPKPSESVSSAIEKFSSNFEAMQSCLDHTRLDEETTKKLINGPLSYTLTHIGQLVFLRRLARNPIAWENYTNAKT